MWVTTRSRFARYSLGVGVLLCTVLACVVPLVARQSITHSLQHAMGQPYQNTMVVTASSLASQDIIPITDQLDRVARQVIMTTAMPAAGVALRSPDEPWASYGLVHVESFPDDYLVPNFTLLAGRFPDAHSATNEVVVSRETADRLHLALGMRIPVSLAHTSRISMAPTIISLVLVGIVEPHAIDPNDPYVTDPVDPVSGGGQLIATALTSSSVVLRIAQAIEQADQGAPGSVQATWVFQVPAHAVAAENFERLQAELQAYYQVPQHILAQYSGTASIYGNALPTLASYDGRITATQVPLIAIAIQIGIVLLWFIVAVVDLLMEREEQTIAVLRSRGASVWQCLPGSLLPIVLLALAAAVLGPWIADWIVSSGLSGTPISVEAVRAVDVGHLGQVLRDVAWYSAAAVGATVVTCAIVLYRNLALTVLTLRRRASRRGRGAFWSKWHLEVVAAVAFLSLYVSYSVFLAPSVGPALYAQMAPLAVYTPIFALVAASMVVFRLVPSVFDWLARLSRRARGTVSVVTLSNLAQGQGSTQQGAMFLALAIALLCFASSYQATRTQHNQAYAAFQVGSDFSFSLPIETTHPLTYKQGEARFGDIPGVQAASAGALIDVFPTVGSAARDRILAVDAQTFASVAAWQAIGAQQSLHTLMQQLVNLRGSAQRSQTVPAIVDDAALQQFHLVTGSTFWLDLSGRGTLRIHFQVISHAAHLPMIPDVAGDDATQFLGGMMVDFQTLAAIIPQVNPKEQAPPGYMWLRTAHDPASVAHIRKTLPLSPFSITVYEDRFQLVDAMAFDPLSEALAGLTEFGAGITLLLALIVSGQILWNCLQKRALTLTALYAVGVSRWQITVISALEALTQLMLAGSVGVALGAVLTLTTVPLMTFAQSSDTRVPIVELLIPPPTIIIPWVALLAGVGCLLLVIFALVAVLAHRHLTHHIAETLRLNED